MLTLNNLVISVLCLLLLECIMCNLLQMLRQPQKTKSLLCDPYPWRGWHFVLRQVTRVLLQRCTRIMFQSVWRSVCSYRLILFSVLALFRGGF